MPIDALRSLTPDEIRLSITQFKPTYVRDWDTWILTPLGRRPALFGQILRRWQATRPYEMRRSRFEAGHPPPHLDDLLMRASEPIVALRSLGLSWLISRTPEQTDALAELWTIFSGLQISGRASCVGISKAVLLATNGQIGPALDSQVRSRLHVRAPDSAGEWLDILDDVGADIRAFERVHGPIHAVVPPKFAKVEDGRLYDMVFGPKTSSP